MSKLEALIAEWRKDAAANGAIYGSAKLECADALEALSAESAEKLRLMARRYGEAAMLQEGQVRNEMLAVASAIATACTVIWGN